MTVKVEIELDMDSYNKKHGPGSDFDKKYGPRSWRGTPAEVKELIEDVISEGLWDWNKEGWLKTNILQLLELLTESGILPLEKVGPL